MGGAAPVAALCLVLAAVAAWVIWAEAPGDVAAPTTTEPTSTGPTTTEPTSTTPSTTTIERSLDGRSLEAASAEAGPDATGPPATDQGAPPAPSPSGSGALPDVFVGGVEVFEVEPSVPGEPSEATVILRADQSGAVTEVVLFGDAGEAAEALVRRGVSETSLDELDTALGAQAYVRIGRFLLIAPGTPASLDLLDAQARHMLGIGTS